MCAQKDFTNNIHDWKRLESIGLDKVIISPIGHYYTAQS